MEFEAVRRLPKALLHDHLDGGLRVQTVLDLADETGYRGLPATDETSLASWFQQADSGSLEAYLDAFEHTVAVMQTAEALERVAFECVTDLAADGVVYAEVRFAPALHTRHGMAFEDTIEAVLSGFRRGATAHDLRIGLIATALRNADDSRSVAAAASRFAGEGVVGFDLAGPELGHPPDRHLEACLTARRAGLGLTIHAGEGDGPNSIWRALALCGAQRIGHGVRIVEDCRLDPDGNLVSCGPLATRVLDHRVPLEVSVTSNIHTGVFKSVADHPVASLLRAGFVVTVNTDNRLMSGITLSDEFDSLMTVNGVSLDELRTATENAIRAGFGDAGGQSRLLERVRKGYSPAS